MAEAAVAALVKLGVDATVAAVTVAAAQVVASAALTQALAKQNEPEAQGNLINLAVSSNEPRRLPIGKRLTGGVLADWYIRGSKNQNLYFIIYLGEGPCGQMTKIYAGGRVVRSTPLSHGVRTTIPDFRSGGDRLWVTYYDGRPGQTADSNLVSKGLGWTSAHKGTGMAYCIVEMQWDSDNLTSPPNMSFELEGAHLYDRRKDSTAGGSGSHRYDNPATWEYTTNPMVAFDHYLLGRISNGVKTFGIGLEADEVPFDRMAALANLCDEQVALNGSGTQTRYEANGFLFADRSFKDTIFDLARSMNARPADFGGRVSLLDGQPKTPVLTLDESDLIDGIPDVYSPKNTWAELVSGVEGRYQDPAQNYQPVDYPRVEDATWAADDGGQAKYATLDLEMEVNAERAQRLAWLYARRKRQQATLTGTYPLKAAELEQGDWFVRTGGRFGESGKVFEVITPIINTKTLTVNLTAVEVNPADSAWDEDGALPAPDAPVEDNTVIPALDVPNISITPTAITFGTVILPAARFTNPDASDPIPASVQAQVAFDNGSGVPTGEYLSHLMPAGEDSSTMYGLMPARAYVARFRASLGERVSAWSSWAAFITTTDYVSGGAGTVPWSGVTGTGRPADNADVTGISVAAGIIGQGWGATASQAEASNDRANLAPADSWARNGNFELWPSDRDEPDGWRDYVNTGTRQIDSDTGEKFIRFITNASDRAGLRCYTTNAYNGLIGIKPDANFKSQYITVSADVRLNSGSSDGLGVMIFRQDSSESTLSSSAISFSDVTPIPVGIRKRVSFVFDLGSEEPTAENFRFHLLANYASGGMGPLSVKEVDLYGVDFREATPDEIRLLDVEAGANVTGDHISAGIIGQGDLATVDSIDLNGPYVTGQLETDSIAANATGTLDYDYGGASSATITSAGPSSWEEIGDKDAISVGAGNEVEIIASVSAKCVFFVMSPDGFTYRISRYTGAVRTTIFESSVGGASTAGDIWHPMPAYAVDTPGAGTHTYKLEVLPLDACDIVYRGFFIQLKEKKV